MKLISIKKFIRIKDIAIGISVLAIVTLISACKGKSVKNDNADVSLYKLYENNYTIGVALSDKDIDDSLTTAIANKHFNSITGENAMKWEYIHPHPGVYDFNASDRLVEFGKTHGKEIVGHVLVWHQQTPEWVFKNDDGSLVSRDTLLERMHDHIARVVGRYKGEVHCWDVVNEAIADDGSIRENIWYNIIGIDYVEKAFEFAREADPDAILIYNDYSLPTPVKREGVVKLVKELKDKGVKIDAIGMQGHYHLDYPDLSEMEQSIISFAAIGCQVMFTELDINVLPHEDLYGADISLNFAYDEKLNPYTSALPDSMHNVLSDRYVSLFEIFNRHADKISRVTIWGLHDGSSWLNHWPVRGRSNYPLLFDRNFQPKPAFWALVRLGKDQEPVKN